MEKYETCKHVLSVGRTAVYVGTGCPRANMIRGTLVSTKTRCRQCLRWEGREDAENAGKGRKILALLKAGMTQKAVREKFGVGHAVIRRIVEENGLLRADRELERHKKLDFPQYLLDDWDETRIELLERARRWQ